MGDVEDNARRIQASADALSKMFVNIDPTIVSGAAKVEPLDDVSDPYKKRVRVSFAPSLAPPDGNMPFPPPDKMMLPNAAFQVLHAQGVKSLRLPPDGPHNSADVKLDELHGALVGDAQVFASQLKQTYQKLLSNMRDGNER